MSEVKTINRYASAHRRWLFYPNNMVILILTYYREMAIVPVGWYGLGVVLTMWAQTNYYTTLPNLLTYKRPK